MMQPYLHMKSLSFMSSFIGLGLFLCMLYVSRTRKVYPGFHCWTTASLFYFIGNILISLRNELPVFISIVLANLAIISIFILIPCGINLFANKKLHVGRYLSALIISLVPFIYFTYITPDIIARIIIISVVGSISSIYAAVVFRKEVVPILNKTNLLAQSSLLIMFVLSLSRGILTLLFEKKLESYLLSSPIQAITIILFCTCFVSACFSFFIVNFQRLEVEYSTAAAELRDVKGFIPICAHCKNIRDDQGYWDRVEAYLSNHSDAEFSHSICPDCFKKHYPEEYE